MSMDANHLTQLLENAAAQRPDHVAIEDEQGATLTYKDLAHAADRLATRLARWGIERGDRVGLFLPKSIEAVAAIRNCESLESYYLFYAVLAEFETQRGNFKAAAEHLRKAIQLTELKSERSLLVNRLNDCEARTNRLLAVS